jgi:hypothetical protein
MREFRPLFLSHPPEEPAMQLPIWLGRLFNSQQPNRSEMHRARDLLAAIDAGGVPLNAAKINQIARDFGLEVSKHAPVEDTIQRIRAAVVRSTL